MSEPEPPGPPSLDAPRAAEPGFLQLAYRGVEETFESMSVGRRVIEWGAALTAIGFAFSMAVPSLGATRSRRLAQQQKKRQVAEAVAAAEKAASAAPPSPAAEPPRE